MRKIKKLKEILFGFFFLLALGLFFIPTLSLNKSSSIYFSKELPRADFFKDASRALHEPEVLSTLRQISIEKNASLSGINLDGKYSQDIKGYIIEVGIFKVLKEAKLVLKKLQKAGYPAFISKCHSSNESYQLLVGPQLQKEDAVKLKTALDVKFNVKGNVIYYVPTDIMKENV